MIAEKTCISQKVAKMKQEYNLELAQTLELMHK